MQTDTITRTRQAMTSLQLLKSGTALLCALLLSAGTLRGQEPLRPRFGGAAHVGLNSHRGDFPRIPGTESCCRGFDGGSGTGFDGGGLAEFPFSGSLLLGARLTFMSQPFSMTTPEGTYVIVNGTGREGTFEHHLDGSLSVVGLEPTLSLRLFGSLFLNVGAWAGYPVATSYEQKEELKGSGTFLNADGTDSHRRTRNEFAGPLPEPALQIAPLAGLSWELPMNADGTLLLAPEISWQLGVTDVIAGTDWKISTLRAGVAVKYSPKESKERQRLQVVVIDTIRIEVPTVAQAWARGAEERSERAEETATAVVITETIRRTDTLFTARSAIPSEPMPAAFVGATGVDARGREFPIVRLKVEEFSSTLMTPLLHYVFFEENSATVPARYKSLSGAETAAFDIDRVNSPERLPTYHHLLNIVGRRMRDNPKATLTLTGCNQDIREEKGDVALSQRRAEAVRNYLTEVWNIEEKRIRIEARGLPEKAANTATADGSQENRRVELASNDPRILAPIITADTLRRVDPPTVRFRMSATAEAGIREWELKAAQPGSTQAEALKSFGGRDTLPALLDWHISRESGTIPRFEGMMEYGLAVTDRRGTVAGSENGIPVEQVTIRKKRSERRGDMEVDRYSLILFDVRSAELLPAHGPIMTLIKKEIEPDSRVSVTGFTDRLGDETYNRELAERRAAAVTNSLGTGVSESQGRGEADLFDSELPEGRLYTRTVEVIIETPVRD